jgi:hypothetical protein
MSLSPKELKDVEQWKQQLNMQNKNISSSIPTTNENFHVVEKNEGIIEIAALANYIGSESMRMASIHQSILNSIQILNNKIAEFKRVENQRAHQQISINTVEETTTMDIEPVIIKTTQPSDIETSTTDEEVCTSDNEASDYDWEIYERCLVENIPCQIRKIKGDTALVLFEPNARSDGYEGNVKYHLSALRPYKYCTSTDDCHHIDDEGHFDWDSPNGNGFYRCKFVHSDREREASSKHITKIKNKKRVLKKTK